MVVPRTAAAGVAAGVAASADAGAEAFRVAYKVEQLSVLAAEQTVMIAVPGVVPPVKAMALPSLTVLAATVRELLLAETK